MNLNLKGNCLVDFLIHRDFIEEKLKSGYSKVAVYTALLEAKKLKMSYNHFRRICSAYSSESQKKSGLVNMTRQAPQAIQEKTPTSHEPKRLRQEHKNSLDFDISTIGKEYLIQPYQGSQG